MAFTAVVIVFCAILLNLCGLSQESICDGEHVTLTCLTNASKFLAWNITFPNGTNHRPELRYISSMGTATCQAPRTVYQTVFQFVRTSISPLISTLAVYNVTSALNGTRVNCLDAEDNFTTISATVINVTKNDIHVASPFLEAHELFGTENITVFFWWTEDKGVLYDNVILPQAFKIYHSSTSIALTMQYNVLYNVSVSLSLCGRISTDTLELNYIKCSYPSLADGSVMIVSYTDQALTGSVMQFRCKDGLLPSDVITATCLRNGTWHPDPTKHNCTLGHSVLSSQTLIAAVTSSIAAFILGSLVFLVIGCIVCGYRCHQHNRTPWHRPHVIEATQPVQLYEEIPQLQLSVKDKDVKLNDNLAYDSLHL